MPPEARVLKRLECDLAGTDPKHVVEPLGEALLEHLHECAEVPHPAQPSLPQLFRSRGVSLLAVKCELPFPVVGQLVAGTGAHVFHQPVFLLLPKGKSPVHHSRDAVLVGKRKESGGL